MCPSEIVCGKEMRTLDYIRNSPDDDDREKERSFFEKTCPRERRYKNAIKNNSIIIMTLIMIITENVINSRAHNNGARKNKRIFQVYHIIQRRGCAYMI